MRVQQGEGVRPISALISARPSRASRCRARRIAKSRRSSFGASAADLGMGAPAYRAVRKAPDGWHGMLMICRSAEIFWKLCVEQRRVSREPGLDEQILKPFLRPCRNSEGMKTTQLIEQGATPARAARDALARVEPAVAANGAEILIDPLLALGVDTVFGHPGGAVLPLSDALHTRHALRHVLVRHEQAAVHPLQVYARTTGKVGVVFVTSGPGMSNTTTGLLDACCDSIPVLCISGQVACTAIGADAFQDCDALGISRPVTKWNVQVRDVDTALRATGSKTAALPGQRRPVLPGRARRRRRKLLCHDPRRARPPRGEAGPGPDLRRPGRSLRAGRVAGAAVQPSGLRSPSGLRQPCKTLRPCTRGLSSCRRWPSASASRCRRPPRRSATTGSGRRGT